MSKGPITAAKVGTLLNLRVSPGARRSSIEGPYGESALKLNVAAPPVDGKANAEAERFRQEALGKPRSDVVVVRGASSRDKVILIHGMPPAQARELLSAHLR